MNGRFDYGALLDRFARAQHKWDEPPSIEVIRCDANLICGDCGKVVIEHPEGRVLGDLGAFSYVLCDGAHAVVSDG